VKFRAQRSNRFGEQWCGPWRRRYPAALADARADIDPMKARISTWNIVDSRDRVREIGPSQYERGLAEYDDAIAHRNAVGVWG
jgi:hypothetical protein